MKPKLRLLWVMAGVLLLAGLGLLGGCGSDPADEPKAQADPLARERDQDWAASVNATDWLASVRTEQARLWAARVGASALASADFAAQVRIGQAARAAEALAAAKADAAKADAAKVDAAKGKSAAKGAASKPKSVAKATPPAKAKAAPAPKGGSGIESAQAQFDAFARKWVGTISRNLRHTAADMALQRDGGGVVARFMEVDHDSLELQVKPSASGGAACPFVGVLRYQEHHYESRAASEAEARQGPFTRTKTQRVTEIFRYVSGRWTN